MESRRQGKDRPGERKPREIQLDGIAAGSRTKTDIMDDKTIDRCRGPFLRCCGYADLFSNIPLRGIIDLARVGPCKPVRRIPPEKLVFNELRSAVTFNSYGRFCSHS